jgi:hypothetical protein
MELKRESSLKLFINKNKKNANIQKNSDSIKSRYTLVNIYIVYINIKNSSIIKKLIQDLNIL